jgi:hypothetical protein
LHLASDLYYQTSSLTQSRGLEIIVTRKMQATNQLNHPKKS